MTHLIITKVNIPRILDPTQHRRSHPWVSPSWNEKRIRLLNKFTRKSLAQQTCQDFIFISLWGEHHPVDRANALPNEIPMYVRRGVDEYDEKAFDFEAWRKGENEKEEEDFAFQIRDIARRIASPPVVCTKLDSDDCINKQYVEVVQRNYQRYLRRAPFYLDISWRYLYNPDTGAKGKRMRSSPSMMVSTIETGSVEVYCHRWHHSMIGDYLEGVKLPELTGMQTVNGTNILTSGTGNSAKFDLSQYFSL